MTEFVMADRRHVEYRTTGVLGAKASWLDFGRIKVIQSIILYHPGYSCSSRKPIKPPSCTDAAYLWREREREREVSRKQAGKGTRVCCTVGITISREYGVCMYGSVWEDGMLEYATRILLLAYLR